VHEVKKLAEGETREANITLRKTVVYLNLFLFGLEKRKGSSKKRRSDEPLDLPGHFRNEKWAGPQKKKPKTPLKIASVRQMEGNSGRPGKRRRPGKESA